MLIVIDKYIFEVIDNIDEIQKSLSINHDKQTTITRPIYTAMGGYDESISFEARLLVNRIDEFAGFENLVKKGEPLLFYAFDLCDLNKKIFITNLNTTISTWVKKKYLGIQYWSKKISISGVLIEEQN